MLQKTVGPFYWVNQVYMMLLMLGMALGFYFIPDGKPAWFAPSPGMDHRRRPLDPAFIRVPLPSIHLSFQKNKSELLMIVILCGIILKSIITEG